MVRPAPIWRTIIPAVTRIPRMQALPPITAGLWVMRSNSSMAPPPSAWLTLRICLKALWLKAGFSKWMERLERRGVVA